MASSSAPARRGHGEAATEGQGHGHAPDPVVVNGVSSDEEPSVEWGWHGHYPRTARFAGLAVAAVMLVMAFWNNHEGQQENIWLVALAVGFLALSVGSIVRARTPWRR